MEEYPDITPNILWAPQQQREQRSILLKFRALVTPLIDIITPYSSNSPMIELQMRNTDGMVCLQWEPFQGCISQNGIERLRVEQSIGSMPKVKLEFPIAIRYKCQPSFATLIIDPVASCQVQIDIPGIDINAGDFISIPGSCVTWII